MVACTKLIWASLFSLLAINASAKKHKFGWDSSTDSSSDSSSSSSDSTSDSSSSTSGSSSSSSTSDSSSSSSSVHDEDYKLAKKYTARHCEEPGLVALTFKGPLSKATVKVAKILKKNDAVGTFYVDGKELIKKYNKKHHKHARKLVGQLVEAGNSIGVVPWGEESWKDIKTKDALKAIKKSARAISKVIGYWPLYVHPPKGSLQKSTLKKLDKLGYVVIGWNSSLEENGKKLPKYKGQSSAKKRSFITYQHVDKDLTKVVKKTLKTIVKKSYTVVRMKDCIQLLPYSQVKPGN